MSTITQPTLTIIALVARKPGTSLAEFKSYYEDRHIPWVTPLIWHGDNHPVSYTRHYLERDGAASSFPGGGAESFGYDCMTHVVFRDQQHRDASLEGYEKYAAEIAADEEKFMDRSAMKVLYVKESVESVTK